MEKQPTVRSTRADALSLRFSKRLLQGIDEKSVRNRPWSDVVRSRCTFSTLSDRRAVFRFLKLVLEALGSGEREFKIISRLSFSFFIRGLYI